MNVLLGGPDSGLHNKEAERMVDVLFSDVGKLEVDCRPRGV
jgi:hypothetical protein